jgi:hypothetical protein
MKYRCKKLGCRKEFFSREELSDHIRVNHRPITSPVLEAKPKPSDAFVATTPGQIRSIIAGPFVVSKTDKGIVITHLSGDSALINWSLVRE